MQLTITKALHAYWSDIKGDRAMPTRADLKPGPISTLLPDLFLLDWSASQDLARFRLAGTRVCAMVGRELAGQNFLSLYGEDQQDDLAEQVSEMFRTGRPLYLDLAGDRDHEVPLRFELLLLPLTGDDGRVTRAVGSLAPENSSAWQMLQPVRTFVVRQSTLLGAHQEEPALEIPPAPTPGFRSMLRRLVPASLRSETGEPPVSPVVTGNNPVSELLG